MFNYAFKEGLWAVLFVSLYYYQLRESRRLQDEAKQREDKLTAFIHDITKQFELLTEQYRKIADDVNDIKVSISSKKGGNP
ncbi:BhlA/UviB family holin-like peptide [Desulfotruncus arcticus]|uniref:BhlA/UviB family holin-like peptide n=1 Tax=Desulfotruncus arcticus TaxID=341036 RepID=UPI000B85844D|nr:BhlA/UviB family holin-like peptide [Desulfotruncus arcticus]